MSLLQRALDRAENLEPEDLRPPEGLSVPPENIPAKEIKSVAPLLKEAAVTGSSPAPVPLILMTAPIETRMETKHESPRLNSIRFYETQNQAVEAAIQKTVTETPSSTPEVLSEKHKSTGRNFLGLIGLLLIFSLGAVRFILPSVDKPETPKTTQTSAVTPAPAPVIVETKKPFYSKPVAQVKFMLTGITASGDTDLAVINNQVVGMGDKLREGATVKSISGNRVVLDFSGKDIILNF